MKEYFEAMKDITIVEPVVTIKGVTKASDDESFSALAEAFRLESSEC